MNKYKNDTTMMITYQLPEPMIVTFCFADMLFVCFYISKGKERKWSGFSVFFFFYIRHTQVRF
jgi:hypothetical protein